jgi:hypothetical protein
MRWVWERMVPVQGVIDDGTCMYYFVLVLKYKWGLVDPTYEDEITRSKIVKGVQNSIFFLRWIVPRPSLALPVECAKR